MDWFKMYAEFATDPKVQSMTEPMQRRLAMLLCLECSGNLDSIDDSELAIALRISLKDLEATRELFVRKGFITESWHPKNWDKRQLPKDRTAAERMRNMRERKRNVDRNVTRNCDVTSRARVRAEGEGEGEEEGGIPPPPFASLPRKNPDKDHAPILRLAADRWSNPDAIASIEDLLREHPPAWVKAALDEEWRVHRTDFQPAYVRAMLRAWQERGGPPKGSSSKANGPPKPVDIPLPPNDPAMIARMLDSPNERVRKTGEMLARQAQAQQGGNHV